MLVLSRYAGEEIVIDHDIRISVVAASRSEVRLGVVAPPSVRVLRQVQRERQPTDDATKSSIMARVIRLAR